MNKLQQRIIDLCLDNSKVSEDEFIQLLLPYINYEEDSIEFKHDVLRGKSFFDTGKEILTAFCTTEDEVNSLIRKMDEVIMTHKEDGKTISEAYEYMIKTDLVPKHMLFLLFDNVTARHNQLVKRLKVFGINIIE